MEFKNLRNWKYKRIEEISDTVTDYVANGSFATLKKNTVYAEKSDYILIRLVDYNNNFNGDFKYITPKSYDFLNKTKLYGGEIIISNVGANAGTVFKVPYLKHKMSLGPNSILLKTKENDEFYFYWFRSIFGQFSLDSIKTGSAQPKFNKTDFRKLSVPVPERDEQNKIAKILNTLDSKIEINNKIISNLESQAQAIFKSWFVDFEPFQDGNFVESELGMIPEGWEVKELGEVADFSNGYSFKSKDLLEEKKSKNDYKVFKQADIKVGGGINPNNTKSWIDSEFIRKNKLSRFIIQSGDLMMCMTDMKNNVRLLGNTALVYQPDEYILNQRVGRLRSKQKEIKPSFLYYLTNNSVFLNDLRGRANTGVQVNLSTSEIKRSKVILPTCDIIKRFCDYSESITKSINSLNSQNTKLAELRDALLPKLMAGEIDVSNIKIEGEEVKNE